MYAKLVLFGSFVVFAAGLVGTVSGQDGYGCPYSWWGCGYPPSYLGEPQPYFALHPPVYYSCRVPRTYGYSPFPYPPYVLTPWSEPRRSTVIQNLYGGNFRDLSGPQEGPQPLRIDNPYVEQSGRSGVTGTRKSAGRKPQIVYPSALAMRRG